MGLGEVPTVPALLGGTVVMAAILGDLMAQRYEPRVTPVAARACDAVQG
jgi:hypothetical protein